MNDNLKKIDYWAQRWQELKDSDVSCEKSCLNAPQLHKIEGIILGLQIANDTAININSKPTVTKVKEFYRNESYS